MKLVLVIDVESSPTPKILGEYIRTEEDAVSYWCEEDGSIGWAPQDCVVVTRGYRYAAGFPAHVIDQDQFIKRFGHVLPPSRRRS